MNVYLACTVRGDRSALAVVRELADAIERLGYTVVTRHLLAEEADRQEGRRTEREVFERDRRWLESADVAGSHV